MVMGLSLDNFVLKQFLLGGNIFQLLFVQHVVAVGMRCRVEHPFACFGW